MFNKVLVAIDGSDASNRASTWSATRHPLTGTAARQL